MRRTRLPLVLALVLGASVARADYSYVRNSDFVVGFRNYYFLGFPDTIGLADVANSSAPWNDKCDLRAGGGDGVINVDDAICTLWGSGAPVVRLGSFSIQRIDENTCRWEARTAEVAGPLGIVFQGPAFALDPRAGYVVQVACNEPAVPSWFPNTGMLTGPCAPGFPSRVVSSRCRNAILPIPDDTHYRKAAEVLCGREGVDWVDADSNGKPDACPNGIFDPVLGGRTSVITCDNRVGRNEFPNTDNASIVYQVELTGGNLVFSGSNFTLPHDETWPAEMGSGSAVWVTIPAGAADRVWAPPIDDALCP